MARIRTIKPEFWDSPGTARASLRARLFFIAMWNYADDWGIGDAHPLRLLSFAFPNDESSDVEPRNFRRLASEVAECFDVEWYEVEGRAFYAIPSWELHQRTEKKAKRRNPGPDQADSHLYDSASENPPHDRELASDGKGKGERGNGKREGGEEPLSPDESDDRGDLIPDDWRPNQTHVDKANSLHLDVKQEYQRFRARAEQTQRRLKNWNTGFTNWLRKSAEFNQQRQGAPSVQPRKQSKAAQNAAEYRRLFGDNDEPAGSVPALDAGFSA